MKIKTIETFAVAFLLSVSLNTAQAEKAATDKAPAKKAGGKQTDRRADRPTRESIIKRFDKDGDGEISDAEKQAQNGEVQKLTDEVMNATDFVRTMQLRKYDKDGDGKLSGEEQVEAHKNLGQDLKAHLSKTFGENIQVVTEVHEISSEDEEEKKEQPEKENSDN